MKSISIGKRRIGEGEPAYIIAEIGSNFDGDLDRAKALALKCKEAGADAYKIQNFLAEKIVSAIGFKNMQIAFQSKWDKPVVEVYKKAEFPREWVKELSDYCAEIGIDFFSAPYDTDAVDLLEKSGVPAHKIGSGEVDNLEFIAYVAKTQKPVILAVGSATPEEVSAAVRAVRDTGNEQLVVLQCVTNYPSPIADANLLAMVEIGKTHGVLYGYSDHSSGTNQGGDDPLQGLTVPLGAIALGGCVIEKHVTDDPTRSGPDHPFGMTIEGDFKTMCAGIRAIEAALGDGKKRLMPSEKETVIIQRRGMYATQNIAAGETINRSMFELLRPAVGLKPRDIDRVVGSKAARAIQSGQPISEHDIA
jgi:sialic acid synthase SpsE